MNSESTSSSSTAVVLQGLEGTSIDQALANTITQHIQAPSATSFNDIIRHTDGYLRISTPVLATESLEHFDIYGNFLPIDHVLKTAYTKTNLFERSDYIRTHITLKRWFADFPFDQNGNILTHEVINSKIRIAHEEIICFVTHLIQNHLNNPEQKLLLDQLYIGWSLADSALNTYGILHHPPMDVVAQKKELTQKIALCYRQGENAPGYTQHYAVIVYFSYLKYIVQIFLDQHTKKKEETRELRLSLLDDFFDWHALTMNIVSLEKFIEQSKIEASVRVTLAFLATADVLYQEDIQPIYLLIQNTQKMKKQVDALIQNNKLANADHIRQLVDRSQLIQKQLPRLQSLLIREKHRLACIGLRIRFLQHLNNHFMLEKKVKQEHEVIIAQLQVALLEQNNAIKNNNKNPASYQAMLFALSKKIKELEEKSVKNFDKAAIEAASQHATILTQEEEQAALIAQNKKNKKKEKQKQQRVEKQKQEWEVIQAKRQQLEEAEQAIEKKQQEKHTLITDVLKEHPYYKKYFSSTAKKMHHDVPSQTARSRHPLSRFVYTHFIQQIDEGIEMLNTTLINTVGIYLNTSIEKITLHPRMMEILADEKVKFATYFKIQGSENALTETLWALSLSYFGIAEYYLLSGNTTRDLTGKILPFTRAKDNYYRSLHCLQVLEKINTIVETDATLLKHMQALREHHHFVCDILKNDVQHINNIISARLKKLYAGRKAAKKRYQDQGREWCAFNKSFATISPEAKERIILQKVQYEIQAILNALEDNAPTPHITLSQ
jgi:hypothetical protein